MIDGLAFRVVLLAGAFGLGTSTFGWAAVPLIAAGWGGIVRDPLGSPVAAVSAGLAWGAMLVWTGWTGPLGDLARQLGEVTGLPGVLWIAAAMLFPTALAWSATTLSSALRDVAQSMMRNEKREA